MRKLWKFVNDHIYVFIVTLPIVAILGCMTVGLANGFSGKL